MEKDKELINDGGIWNEKENELKSIESKPEEEIKDPEKIRPKSRIKKSGSGSITNKKTDDENKKEDIDLTPEIKEKLPTQIKLDIEDLLVIIKLNANVQTSHADLNIAKLKFENTSLVFDSTFKDLVNKYNIPNGWKFNLDAGVFLPPQ